MILPVCFLQVYNSSFLSLCFGLSLSFGFFSFSSFSSSSVFSFLPSFFFARPPFSLFRVFSSFFSLLGLFFLFPPFFAAVLGAIYRASECGFLLWRMGSRSHGGWSAIGCYCRGSAPPVFWQARGGWAASVFGRRSNGVGLRVGGLEARKGRQNLNESSFSLLPRCMFGGKKKEERCRSKRHRSALFFSFF
jgi:hypothetical protein